MNVCSNQKNEDSMAPQPHAITTKRKIRFGPTKVFINHDDGHETDDRDWLSHT